MLELPPSEFLKSRTRGCSEEPHIPQVLSLPRLFPMISYPALTLLHSFLNLQSLSFSPSFHYNLFIWDLWNAKFLDSKLNPSIWNIIFSFSYKTDAAKNTSNDQEAHFNGLSQLRVIKYSEIGTVGYGRVQVLGERDRCPMRVAPDSEICLFSQNRPEIWNCV